MVLFHSNSLHLLSILCVCVCVCVCVRVWYTVCVCICNLGNTHTHNLFSAYPAYCLLIILLYLPLAYWLLLILLIAYFCLLFILFLMIHCIINTRCSWEESDLWTQIVVIR